MSVARGSFSRENAIHNICIPTLESESTLAAQIVDSALISALSKVTGQSLNAVTQSLSQVTRSKMEVSNNNNNNNNNNNMGTETTGNNNGLSTSPEHLKSAMLNTRTRKISADGRKRSVTFDPKLYIKDASVDEEDGNTENKAAEVVVSVNQKVQNSPTISISSFEEDDECDLELELEITRL